MSKYLEAAVAMTHDTERKQKYPPGRSKHSLDREVPEVEPQDKYDQGEPMRRGMQGGRADIPRDEPVEGIRAKDPVEMAADPTLKGHDVNPRTGRVE
jgi:hypothetical protein